MPLMNKETITVGATAGLIGLVVPALLSLGIFATRAEVAEFKAEIAEKYISRMDVENKLEKIERAIEKLIDKIDKGK